MPVQTARSVPLSSHHGGRRQGDQTDRCHPERALDVGCSERVSAHSTSYRLVVVAASIAVGLLTWAGVALLWDAWLRRESAPT
jgi:hypothetical protein